MSTQTLPKKPSEVWQQIRGGSWRGVTSGVAPGYVQANLAILPQDLAFEFLLFCQRNPKPCPVLEVIEAGNVEPVLTAAGADIRTDIPGYRIYENGVMVDEVESLVPHWRDDLVSFLMGCSFSFETAMIEAGIPLRHQYTHRSFRAIFRSDGGQYASDKTGADSPGRPGDLTVPGDPWRAGPHWRSLGDRHQGHFPAGLRGRGGHLSRRGAGVLGLRCNSPGGGA